MRRGLGTELRMVGGADPAEERSRQREEPVQRPLNSSELDRCTEQQGCSVDLWMGNSEPRGDGLRSGERQTP